MLSKLSMHLCEPIKSNSFCAFFVCKVQHLLIITFSTINYRCADTQNESIENYTKVQKSCLEPQLCIFFRCKPILNSTCFYAGLITLNNSNWDILLPSLRPFSSTEDIQGSKSGKPSGDNRQYPNWCILLPLLRPFSSNEDNYGSQIRKTLK